MTASAAKLKKVNVDKYIGLGKKYTVFAYNPNRKWIKVRTRKSKKANYYSQMINYGGALVVNTSKLKKVLRFHGFQCTCTALRLRADIRRDIYCPVR